MARGAGAMRATPTKPIEDIVPDVHRAGSVRLVSAGRTVLSVPVEVVVAERIEPGSTLSPGQVDRLERAADLEAAYRTAVRLLERRQFARGDLSRRLAMKGHPPESVQAAVARAEQAGYLDDARFATNYVRSRTARGRGPARLRRELLLMGVSRPTVDAALAAEIGELEAQGHRIEQLIAKRLPQLRARSAPNLARRLLAFLGRRGYTGPEVGRLVRMALKSSSGGGDRRPPPD